MQFEVGAIVEGKVTGITKFGAFVELPGNKTGMVHISEIAPVFVKEIRDHVKEGQMVKVKVLSISEDGNISRSIKKARDPPPRREFRPAPRQPRPERPGNYEWQKRTVEGGSFEDMMSRFKQASDEKMSDLKRCMDSKRGGSGRHGGSGRG